MQVSLQIYGGFSYWGINLNRWPCHAHANVFSNCRRTRLILSNQSYKLYHLCSVTSWSSTESKFAQIMLEFKENFWDTFGELKSSEQLHILPVFPNLFLTSVVSLAPTRRDASMPDLGGRRSVHARLSFNYRCKPPTRHLEKGDDFYFFKFFFYLFKSFFRLRTPRFRNSKKSKIWIIVFASFRFTEFNFSVQLS